jgi:hypothetical protein
MARRDRRYRRKADPALSGVQQAQKRISKEMKISGGLKRSDKEMEPTIGLEPMTCRLRIDCSTN